MKLSLDLRTSLTQTLTPQQIQYLKLLQMPVIQLEQQIHHEIEQNPMLEEGGDDLYQSSGEFEGTDSEENFENQGNSEEAEAFQGDFLEHDEPAKALIDDSGDPFEFYKLVWQDNEEPASGMRSHTMNDEDFEPFQIKDSTSFIEDILQQFRFLPLSDEEIILGEQIIGNTDDDGYLRRELSEILEETNDLITEINEAKSALGEEYQSPEFENDSYDNPARQFAIPPSLLKLIEEQSMIDKNSDMNPFSPNNHSELKHVSLSDAERILKFIQELEPPGIGSRSVQECLLAQCRVISNPAPVQKLAAEILEKAYEPFSMKHFNVILKQFNIGEDELREAIEIIRRLNPKPGGGNQSLHGTGIIPDFIIEREADSDELLITVNDGRVPTLQLSKLYERMKKEARFKHFNKETREWIRTKFEDAKFLIQAIRQRKNTMLKVMTAIAALQKNFFYDGPSALKPMIYKDISETTGLDISTVCRIVNGKYVQTEYGIYDLKYFFSESLPSEDGEEVSTTVIKQIIREIIGSEPKSKPHSDDKITKELKKKGYNVARRTVAKYREQLKIPVARLRREL